MCKPEKLLSRFLCPRWKFIQCKPIYSEGERERCGGGGGAGIVGPEVPCFGFAVSAMCRGEREEGDGKRGEAQPQLETILHEIYLFRISFPFCCFHSILFLIHGGNICQQFAAGESHSLPNLFLGAKKAASGSNLRGLYDQKRMFSECLPVTYNPLQGPRAGGSCSVVLVKD